MSTIPKEIMQKIEAECEQVFNEFFGTIDEQLFRRGAEYGYQLATDGREEKILTTSTGAMPVVINPSIDGREDLEKDIAKLKEAKEHFRLCWEIAECERDEEAKQITVLQSSLKEKDDELGISNHENKTLRNRIDWQSEQLKEKDQEIAELKAEDTFSSQTIEKLVKQISELRDENERLKGLIKDEFIGVMKTAGGIDEEESEKMWQQFKSENNL